MAKYISKPVTVDAVRIDPDTTPLPGRSTLTTNMLSVAEVSGWLMAHGISGFAVQPVWPATHEDGTDDPTTYTIAIENFGRDGATFTVKPGSYLLLRDSDPSSGLAVRSEESFLAEFEPVDTVKPKAQRKPRNQKYGGTAPATFIELYRGIPAGTPRRPLIARHYDVSISTVDAWLRTARAAGEL